MRSIIFAAMVILASVALSLDGGRVRAVDGRPVLTAARGLSHANATRPHPTRAQAVRPIDLFTTRLSQTSPTSKVIFTGVDPNNLGNANAGAKNLAQVQDSDGTLGRITLQSPGFWRYVGKGLVVVGSTGTGVLAGAVAGTVVPGLGTAAGAIVGGASGCLTSVGTAIVFNTGGSNPRLTQDVTIYDQIIVETSSGDYDLKGAIITAVVNDPSKTTITLPGGGLLLRPSPSLFAGSKVVDNQGATLPDGDVEVGVIDVDGDTGTAADRVVAVFFQDLVRGILLDDEVGIFLDNVVPTGILSDGNPIRSRHCFAQTLDSNSSDVTPPGISLSGTGTDSQGRKFINVTVQDGGTGLASISVVEAVNVTMSVPGFTTGTQSPVVITATKIDQSLSSRVVIRSSDQSCNSATGDPVVELVVRRAAEPVRQTLTNIPRAEHKVRVHNSSPGLTSLGINVNGKNFQLGGLRDNEVRAIDVSSAMRAGGDNIITLTAKGKPGGSAVVVIHD